MLCFPGTYAPLTGANECRVCPSGYTCPSYGTYEPTVCEVGHYRSLSDSVTCRPCPTGTFSSSPGVTDISSCLPCPPGRICGVQAMVNLTESNVRQTGRMASKYLVCRKSPVCLVVLQVLRVLARSAFRMRVGRPPASSEAYANEGQTHSIGCPISLTMALS